ncbi:MAG: hypothetical protein WAV72_09385 [Bradyrhizobium sp.]
MPMIGGMISSTLLTLIVIPAIYGLIKEFRFPSEDRFESRRRPPPKQADLTVPMHSELAERREP